MARAAARAAEPATEDAGSGAITIRLDELLSERGMTLTQLSEQVGITVVNLSILKNGRARAIRFSTLAGLCAALSCQPGDLLGHQPGPGLRASSADEPARLDEALAPLAAGSGT
jgi:putative transcriptional regulator